MKTANEILTKAGEQFVKDLRAQFSEFGLNDTHAAEQSLSSKVSNQILSIEGLLRILFLIIGRRPGPISDEGVKKIGEWITRKLGLTKDSKEWKKAKYFIVKKIREKGTVILNDKSKALKIELIIEDINEKLQKELNTQIGLDVTESVFKAYQ